jgi:formylmethanofuran dehydrogenase subunit C/murein DD-endopeptidase MepM/ murein hydrolase activator NlpD
MNFRFLFIIVFIICSAITSNFSFAIDIKPFTKPSILEFLKDNHTGDSSELDWLKQDDFELAFTSNGHLMSITSAFMLSKTFDEFESSGCVEIPTSGIWTPSCVNDLRKIQEAFSQYQKTMFEKLQDTATKKSFELVLKGLDKSISYASDGVNIEYGSQWGYGTIKTAFEIFELASSDKDTAYIEAAMKLLAKNSSKFGPQAALGGAYINFLFDFMDADTKGRIDIWANMYFAYYMAAKQSQDLDTYFEYIDNQYYPKRGSPLGNLMFGFDSSGNQLRSVDGFDQAGFYWEDEFEYITLIKSFIPSAMGRIDIQYLDDALKQGIGLISFYESMPQLNLNDLQNNIDELIRINKHFETSITLFDYMIDTVSKDIDLQYNTQSYSLNSAYIVETNWNNEKSNVISNFQPNEFYSFKLESLKSDSAPNSYIHFNSMGLKFERKLTDFNVDNIFGSIEVQGDEGERGEGSFYKDREIKLLGRVSFNISETGGVGGYQDINWTLNGEDIKYGLEVNNTLKELGEYTIALNLRSQNGTEKTITKKVISTIDSLKSARIKKVTTNSEYYRLGESITITVDAESPDLSPLNYLWFEVEQPVCNTNENTFVYTATEQEKVDLYHANSKESLIIKPVNNKAHYCVYVSNGHGGEFKLISLYKAPDDVNSIEIKRLNEGFLPAQYQIQVQGGVKDNTSYSWSFGNGSGGVEATGNIITYNDSQQYTISLTATRNNSSVLTNKVIFPQGEVLEIEDNDSLTHHCGENPTSNLNKIIACFLFNKTFDELDDDNNGVNYNYNNWGNLDPRYYDVFGHQGIDMQTKNVVGGNADNNLEPFYSVSNGKVIEADTDGKYHLISVYDASKDISVIYLHAQQIDVSVGQNIKVGDKLGIQGRQGAENRWHVHVEVRQGPVYGAATSKSDSLNPIGNIMSYLGGYIDDSNKIVSSINILGATSVTENLSAHYQLQVNFDDGSSSIKPANSWEVRPSVSKSSINSEGLLIAESVDYDKTFLVWATYGELAALHKVTILEESTVSKPDTTLTWASSTETCGINGSVTVSVYRPSGHTCSYTDNGQSYSKTVGQLDTIIPHNLTIENGTLDTEGKTIIVNGDLHLKSGAININKGQLIVRGNLIHAGGSIYVAEGSLIVKGDYRIQTPSESEGEYTFSIGRLVMTNPTDYVLVHGDFNTDGPGNYVRTCGGGTCSSKNVTLLTAGILELKGSFIQQSSSTESSHVPYYNFQTSGTHKVVLSGDTTQNITFEDNNHSFFNELEILNTTENGVVWLSDYNVTTLTASDIKLAPMTISHRALTLYHDVIIAGDLTVSGGVNLNGYTLMVEGDLIHSAGNLSVAGGTLVINGDYRIQTPSASEGEYTFSTGRLVMTSPADYVVVNGDFYTDGQGNYVRTCGGGTCSGKNVSLLTAGLLELKGNFTQQSSSTESSHVPYYNFQTSGTHKVVLSGDTTQNITFEDGSQSFFNELEILNTTENGVVWLSDYNAIKLIASDIKLAPMTISHRALTLYQDVTIAGDLTISGAVNLNGYSLTIEGDLIHRAGNLSIAGGSLVVNGDYRIQTPADNEGEYTFATGDLVMADPDDYVLVKGDFYNDGNGNPYSSYGNTKNISLLTAGILELKGDFTQQSTNSGYSAYNFQTSGSHKVILSGDSVQNITFEDGSQSFFNELEIKNISLEGIKFLTSPKVVKLFNHNRLVFNSELEGYFADYDADGIKDNVDEYPMDAHNVVVDTDLDGIPDFRDTDDDNDDVLDTVDAFSLNVAASIDTDLDGLPNSFHGSCNDECITKSGLALDLDDDNDGVPDGEDDYPLDPEKSKDDRIALNIYAPESAYVVAVGETVTIPVMYKPSDNSQINALSFKLYFNSQLLQWNQVTNLISTGLLGGMDTVFEDTDDSDNNPLTDSYLQVTWFDLSSNWPGESGEVKLFDIELTLLQDLGEDTTVLNVVGDDAGISTGYKVVSDPINVAMILNSFTLDINGDGKVSLPIDGFIILRSMVGFPASALASNDDMFDASRTRDEMADLLNNAKTDLSLDINGDGKVSLPIDGFIILRHMVGFPASSLASDEDMTDATRTKDEMKRYMESF